MEMGKKGFILLVAVLCAAVALCAVPALADEEDAEWTVMFYMCGSDLESRYEYATGNLMDISQCRSPMRGMDEFEWLEGDELGQYSASGIPEKVNVIIQTGGCREWHAKDLGMDIDARFIQRWSYEYGTSKKDHGTFTLEETLPSASMADPYTLEDFVRWGAENYPARKYALVLWDHGSGSKSGLMIDELYPEDFLHLDELGAALRNSGVHLEAVIFDACLMANMETAYAIHDSANWMIASQELVAGKGTAINAWLQQLYFVPHADGEMLGRWVCDMTQIKYANDDNTSAQQLMTWSVIDLSKIPRVVSIFDQCYSQFCNVYMESPRLVAQFAKSMYMSEHYGSANDNMFDLSGLLYRNTFNTTLEANTRWLILDAMQDAVAYCIRGSGRASARGLSFCYATNFTPGELDIYARNCPSPHYLAHLDVISPWTAPDWVYETVDRMPEMDTIDAYLVKVNKTVFDDGTPSFTVEPGYDINIGTVRYSLYYKNEETENVICLGTAPAYYDTRSGEEGLYRAYKMWLWPSIDGMFCQVDVQSIPIEGNYNTLYNVPIMMNSEVWVLRCGYMTSSDSYTVYGLWEGFDSDSEMFNRNVKELSHVAGREYRLLYEIDTGDKDAPTAYEFSKPMTMYRALNMEDAMLPPGTYFMEYVIYDVFMRPMTLERIELYWDGERLTIPNQDWSGSETLNAADYYKE